ncbi:hypothetical protein [Cupriavidus sp. UYPR2.512]|uniref:hypothetical protein n=1 Tax=Cupriavidus sp. UYPR2.512 TaxID=1080187 RepID=UPI0003718E6A|nr:hypothetical protein [Cupriavidus sp. UYPR2.512]
MTKIMIAAEHAAKLLPRGKKVHTFIRVFAWVGADVDRARVLAAFESAKEVEVSSYAACLDHHLVIELDGMRTYINTNPKALRRLHPQVAAGGHGGGVNEPDCQYRAA